MYPPPSSFSEPSSASCVWLSAAMSVLQWCSYLVTSAVLISGLEVLVLSSSVPIFQAPKINFFCFFSCFVGLLWLWDESAHCGKTLGASFCLRHLFQSPLSCLGGQCCPNEAAQSPWVLPNFPVALSSGKEQPMAQRLPTCMFVTIQRSVDISTISAVLW